MPAHQAEDHVASDHEAAVDALDPYGGSALVAEEAARSRGDSGGDGVRAAAGPAGVGEIKLKSLLCRIVTNGADSRKEMH